jgi:hypothetical protein
MVVIIMGWDYEQVPQMLRVIWWRFNKDWPQSSGRDSSRIEEEEAKGQQE